MSDEFSPTVSDSAREVSLPEQDSSASQKENSKTKSFRAARPWFFDSEEARGTALPSTASRAEPELIPSIPPARPCSPATLPNRCPQIGRQCSAEIVDLAVEIARKYARNHVLYLGPDETRRLLERFWPRYVRDQIRIFQRYGYHRQFDPNRDLAGWKISFHCELEREDKARQRYHERREKWERERVRAYLTDSACDLSRPPR